MGIARYSNALASLRPRGDVRRSRDHPDTLLAKLEARKYIETLKCRGNKPHLVERNEEAKPKNLTSAGLPVSRLMPVD
jgi:hypothetical protein